MLRSAIELLEADTIHGKGLKTTKRILKGEVIWQFDPSLPTYTLSEIEELPEEQQKYFSRYSYQCSEDRFVLADPGLDRYMNHSCDPNLYWKDNQTLVACRDIDPGEEISYDYTTNDILVDYQMKCNCGSNSCRQIITNKDYLDTGWQEKYGTHLPDHTLKAIARAKLKSEKATDKTQKNHKEKNWKYQIVVLILFILCVLFFITSILETGIF